MTDHNPAAQADNVLAEAIAHQQAGRHRDVVALLVRTANDAARLTALGRSLSALKRRHEALAAYDAAFALAPDTPYLAGARWREAMEACVWEGFDRRRQDVLDAMDRGVVASAPFILLMAGRDDLARRAAADWLARYPRGDCPAPPPSPDGRIRIGWFSGDFRNHAVTHLLTGVLEKLDRHRFRNFGFSFGPDDGSAERKRIIAAMDRFLDVRSSPDDQVAALARSLGCDIAIDLTGFTQFGRFGVFTRRAAPVQVNWLGYPGSMGGDAHDYIIADSVVLPSGAERDYAECVVRLPHAYQPTDDCRTIAPRPGRLAAGLPAEGFVYCCFNAASKLTPEIFEIWMRLLQRAPGSVLWLMRGQESVQDALRAETAKRGVDPDRLIFAQPLPQARHLARMAEADLFLDTLPYNAHTTASDALWAGLPVLTCPGSGFAGRVAASLLRAAGLPDLIAPDLAAYEERAAGLAADAGSLRALRDRLAHERSRAVLFDTARFAQDLGRAFAVMHERSVAGARPAPFDLAPEPPAAPRAL